MPDDPVLGLAAALTDAHERVRVEVEGRGSIEADRALEFVLSAYDLAVEMWFQKGDPAAPGVDQLGAAVEKVRRGQPDHHLPECAGGARSHLPAPRRCRQRRLRRGAGLHQGSGLQRTFGQYLGHATLSVTTADRSGDRRQATRRRPRMAPADRRRLPRDGSPLPPGSRARDPRRSRSNAVDRAPGVGACLRLTGLRPPQPSSATRSSRPWPSPTRFVPLATNAYPPPDDARPSAPLHRRAVSHPRQRLRRVLRRPCPG